MNNKVRGDKNAICFNFIPYLLNICKKFEFFYFPRYCSNMPKVRWVMSYRFCSKFYTLSSNETQCRYTDGGWHWHNLRLIQCYDRNAQLNHVSSSSHVRYVTSSGSLIPAVRSACCRWRPVRLWWRWCSQRDSATGGRAHRRTAWRPQTTTERPRGRVAALCEVYRWRCPAQTPLKSAENTPGGSFLFSGRCQPLSLDLIHLYTPCK